MKIWIVTEINEYSGDGNSSEVRNFVGNHIFKNEKDANELYDKLNGLYATSAEIEEVDLSK